MAKKRRYSLAELAIGIYVEAEHGHCVAMRDKVAKDHLREDPRYYTKLIAFEAGQCPRRGSRSRKGGRK
jgi:hypothetical protein